MKLFQMKRLTLFAEAINTISTTADSVFQETSSKKSSENRLIPLGNNVELIANGLEFLKNVHFCAKVIDLIL